MAYHPKHSTDKPYLINLVASSDYKTAQTGKVFGDITCEYCEGEATSWSAYSVTADNWKEIDDGLYWLTIGASEFTTEGANYAVRVSCAGCVAYVLDIEVGPKVDTTWLAGSDDRATELAELAQYLMANGVDPDTVVHVYSVLGRMMNDGIVWGFDGTTDSMKALRDKLDALNNLSSGEAQTAAAAALTAYDGPTHDELTSGLAGLNDPAAAEIVAALVADADFINILAYCHGKTSRNESTAAVTFFADDGETELFTITPALTGRTVT